MKKKYLTIAIIFFGVIATGIILFSLFVSPKNRAFIPSLQLLPFVSHSQARATICAKENNAFSEKICEEKFDLVAKDDIEKIDELFLILSQIQNDKKLPPYEKFIFGQLVFATLPNGDGSTALNGKIFSWIANIASFFGIEAYAKNTTISREQYEEHLTNDLVSVFKNCPKSGDENWILTAMCSEYSWIDNERQPIYSKEYIETGGPNWCNEQGEAGAIGLSHVQSIINTKMRSEYNFSDSSGLSNDIACMFSCVSYPSAEVAGKPSAQKCDPVAKFNDFTEVGYSGDDFLKNMIDKIRNAGAPSQPEADTEKDAFASQEQKCFDADGVLKECPRPGQVCKISESIQQIRACASDVSFETFVCRFHNKSGPEYERCAAKYGSSCDYGQYLWEIAEDIGKIDCPDGRLCQNGRCVSP